MKLFITLNGLLLCICTFAANNQAFAKSESKNSPHLLREGNVTEDDIVKALTPSVTTETSAALLPTDEEAGGKTRGIRLAPPPPSQNAAVVKPAKANLLITFVTNSVELTSAAKQTLDIVAKGLMSEKLRTFKFYIEGHADRRGKAEDNLQLSMRRAEAVKNYLVTNHKLNNERLLPIGKGDREPLVVEQPTASENRRVTFVTSQ